MRRPLARHGARTRRVSRHESATRRPRTGRAARAAPGRSVGRTLEASLGSRDLLGISRSGCGIYAARRFGTSLAGLSMCDAGAFWKFDRVGVLDHAVADAK